MSKHLLTLCLTLACAFGAIPAFATSHDLSERVRGHILLQVEGRGEAWYVDPVLGSRFYMKDGPTAYEMMRHFGLGISEANYLRIGELADELSGRIVLRVQAHGEAYYIHPDGTVHYLKDGNAAYEVMRSLSLGITDADLEQVEAEEMPAEVAERLAGGDVVSAPVPVSEPVPVNEPVPTDEPVFSLEDVERLAQEFARKLVEEQERVAAEKESARIAEAEEAEEAAERAAEFALAEKEARKAEADRVVAAIAEKSNAASLASPYRAEMDGWMDTVADKINHVCLESETVQQEEDCQEAMDGSGLSKAEIVASQKKNGVVYSGSSAQDIDSQCANIYHDGAPCDLWMQYVRSLFVEMDEVRALHKELMKPYNLALERFRSTFAPTLKDGSPASEDVLTDSKKEELRTELGEIGITTFLLD